MLLVLSFPLQLRVLLTGAALPLNHSSSLSIDTQAFGEGQEHHTLRPVLETVEARYKKLGITESIYQQGTVVTADTGFANEANMQYLHEQRINGYIPDNRFCSRDPKFAQQKDKYGKRHQRSSSPAGGACL